MVNNTALLHQEAEASLPSERALCGRNRASWCRQAGQHGICSPGLHKAGAAVHIPPAQQPWTLLHESG